MPVEMHAIERVFPGTRALDGVSIDFREGEVHSVIGENGAGKSTLLGILSGSLRPSAGTLKVNGETVHFRDASAAKRHGIAHVSQEGSLVPHLSGAENVMLGSEPRFAGIVRRAALLQEARQLAQTWFPHSEIDLTLPVESLPFAEQKVVEILRALKSAARILILDEPTAALPAREKEQLWALIRSLAQRGIGIVYVSHLLSEVLSLSDRISVLRDGRLVAQTTPAQCDEAGLVGHMLGRAGGMLAREPGRAAGSGAREVLAVDGWSGDGFEVAEFRLHAGEIVGLVGLSHAGHQAFAFSLYEPALRRSGTLRIDGRPVQPAGTPQARRLGLALVPDHRMRNSLVAGWTLRENLSVAHLDAGSYGRSAVLNGAREQALAKSAMQQLRIKAHSPEQAIEELSGGNKQKVSIGKWLYGEGARPAEPTEGVDVGAKAEIHRIVRELAAAGLGVIVVSSDLLEVQALADRVLPFHRGRPVAPIDCDDFSERRFVVAMAAGQ